MILAQIDDLPITWGLVGVVCSVAAGTAVLTRHLSNQFSKQTRLFFRVISRHNREDDDRFQALSDEMWGVRELISNISGRPLPARRSFPRRRYLVDDGEHPSEDDNDDKDDTTA